MNRKIITILLSLLMTLGTVTIVLKNHNETSVKATELPESGIGIDYQFTWERVEDFGNVIHDADWSEENDIPKGRSWATAGEEYTINEILDKYMNGENTACGLTDYAELPIGYVSGLRGKFGGIIEKQYSTKIVVHNYSLSLINPEGPDLILSHEDVFPFGIGFFPNINTDSRTHFDNLDDPVTIRNLDDYPIIHPFSGASYNCYYNVSATVLNNFPGVLGGTVKYIEEYESMPENQNDTVFIINETNSCITKIQNITQNATGCILIHDQIINYTFVDAANQNCSFTRIKDTDANISLLLADLENETEFFVMLDNETQTLNFFDLSYTPEEETPWVGLMSLRYESDQWGSGYSKDGYDGIDVIQQNRNCWIYNKLNHDNECKAIIIVGPGDTHFMLPTVHGWRWFNVPFWLDVYYVPMFSVAEEVKTWLDNHPAATVEGFIDQELYQQTHSDPGVVSHNVVAYRNNTKSPDDKIVVLSNRMDSWWSEAPGDSGVGGAILLGIAKYLKDNDIIPKYNLTFLFTTGEEFGMRGAQHFVDTHECGIGAGKYNYIYWIGFEQLGFYLTNSQSKLLTSINTTDDENLINLISTIASQTNYEERTGDNYDFGVGKREGGAAEDYVWKDNCPVTILFEKSGGWDGWHRAGGDDYEEGDSLQYIDRNDVDVTFELAWNVTKYFIVNPECQF
ncbi:MAG TPA: M28 family peptidase, partial [Candidatus Thermoplasmatota archaeon]|nr:M28 family peptidase [Candidatus Thermoplasmatota archaeon]